MLDGLKGVVGARKGMRHMFGVPLIGRAPMPYDVGPDPLELQRRIYNAIDWSPVIGFYLGHGWQVKWPMARRDRFPSRPWAR